MGLTRPTYGAIPSQDEIFAFLHHAYEAGVTFWDSADYYNDCEEIIGKWFRRTGKRGDIFLATKFGYVKNSQTFEPNTSYVYVKKACAESLRLLDIESIDLSIVAAMPLGRGPLTANFIERTASGHQDSDVRYQLIPRFTGENREKNIQLVSQFKGLADKKGITTAQLAIAWLLKQGEDIIRIPGTKRIQYFDENWATFDIVLSDEEEAEIRSFVEKADIAGMPLPPAFDGWLFRDTKGESV
ncbi:hypothetical protein ACKAV7_010494 [Fusarium commune]